MHRCVVKIPFLQRRMQNYFFCWMGANQLWLVMHGNLCERILVLPASCFRQKTRLGPPTTAPYRTFCFTGASYRTQLLKGRLVLNPGFSFFLQKHFFGLFSLLLFKSVQSSTCWQNELHWIYCLESFYADTLKVSSGALIEVTLFFRYSTTDREATRVLALFGHLSEWQFNWL